MDHYRKSLYEGYFEPNIAKVWHDLGACWPTWRLHTSYSSGEREHGKDWGLEIHHHLLYLIHLHAVEMNNLGNVVLQPKLPVPLFCSRDLKFQLRFVASRDCSTANQLIRKTGSPTQLGPCADVDPRWVVDTGRSQSMHFSHLSNPNVTSPAHLQVVYISKTCGLFG